MAPTVVPLELDVRWDPNDPAAVLVNDDRGRGALSLRAHPDDVDQRRVVLRWDRTVLVRFGPNDEGLWRHPLYERGLSALLWAGVVRDSDLVASEEASWTVVSDEPLVKVRPLHFVVRTKECLFEVLAENLDVCRAAGDGAVSATASIT